MDSKHKCITREEAEELWKKAKDDPEARTKLDELMNSECVFCKRIWIISGSQD